METIEESSPSENYLSRRSLLKAIGLGAVVTAASSAIAGCGGSSSSATATSGDLTIVNVAVAAEGLAATFYANLFTSSVYSLLAAHPVDQANLAGAYIEEINHYSFLTGTLGGTAQATNSVYYFPTGTFTSTQQTLTTLNIIEDLLIAIYTIGVGQFSTDQQKIYAAQILGVEAEHRVLGRYAAGNLGLSSESDLANAVEPIGSSYPINDYYFEKTFPSVTGTSNVNTVSTLLTTDFQTVGAGGFSQQQYTLALSPSLSPLQSLQFNNYSYSE
jgi:hypothetical protein